MVSPEFGEILSQLGRLGWSGVPGTPGAGGGPRVPIGVNLKQKTVKIRRRWHPRCISFFIVTPAKAGVQAHGMKNWIPDSAGMTKRKNGSSVLS